MSRYALPVVVLLILCQARYSSSSFDPATHVAVTTSTTNYTGTEEKLAGLDVYVSGSLDSSAAVLMISDVFGWKAPLFRKLADKIANNGYYVVAPDFFHGDPIVNISDVDTWILRHPQGLVKAIVQLHPTSPATSDYATETTPLMVLAAPLDGIQNFTSVLESRKQHHVKVFVKIFKDVVHGWTIRYNESDPKQVYRAYRAHGLLLKWYHKYLHV